MKWGLAGGEREGVGKYEGRGVRVQTVSHAHVVVFMKSLYIGLAANGCQPACLHFVCAWTSLYLSAWQFLAIRAVAVRKDSVGFSLVEKRLGGIHCTKLRLYPFMVLPF